MNERAITFEDYLAALPPERRGEVKQVWQMVRDNVPCGYVERIDSKFLMYAADGAGLVMLASQQNYLSLYLMPLYVFPEMKAKLDAAAGTKPKRDKSCLTFKRADELPLKTIAEILAACPDALTYQRHLQQVCVNGR